MHGPPSRVTEKEKRTRPGRPYIYSGTQSSSAPKFSLVLADIGSCFYAFDNFLPFASFFASPVPHPLPHCSLVSFPHRVARPRCALTHLAPRTSFPNASLIRTATLTVPQQVFPSPAGLSSLQELFPGPQARLHGPSRPGSARYANTVPVPRPARPCPDSDPLSPWPRSPDTSRSRPGHDRSVTGPAVLLIRALASCAFSERSTQSAIAHDILPGHPRGLRC